MSKNDIPILKLLLSAFTLLFVCNIAYSQKNLTGQPDRSPSNYGGSTVSQLLGPVSLNYFAK